MESRILNLSDAMKLASILGKHINSLTPPERQLAIEFISDMLDKMSAKEYGEVLTLLTDKPIAEIYKETEADNQKLLVILFTGLEKNRILILLDSYNKIGFSQ